MSTTAESTRTYEGLEIPTPGTFTTDLPHSDVGFVVRHMMVSKVRGRFRSFTATITVADEPLESTVVVEIDAASIETRDEKRNGHLRSPDFFDVENYPKITYRSTGLRFLSGNRFEVDGDLTVHGVTRPVTLEATFEGATPDGQGGQRIGFSASAEVNREDFGLTWNQAMETGGVLVGKTARLEIEVEAIRQES